jgi:hypothetical protein
MLRSQAMRTKLIHPVWVHLPAAAALVVLIIFLVSAGPLPAEAPIHFSFGGEPNNYGSPWASFGLAIGLSILFIIISIILDELWARQEKKKTYNWISLMDDIFTGLLAGTNLGYLSFLQGDAESFSFPWGYALIVAGAATVLAIIIEMLRPYRPYSSMLVSEDSRALNAEIASHLKDGSPFIYWDYQNPLYVSIISIILPIVMLVAAVISLFSMIWVAVILFIVGCAMIIPYGGQRTIITRQDISVRWGIFGLRVLRLKIPEIVEATIHEFSPLKDFGGYGIRFNREMRAYYLRGTRGIKFTTTSGKKYLIGSDHPEQMHAVASSLISANTGA